MEISQKLLAVMLAASAAAGAALGLVWDVLRLLRSLAAAGKEKPDGPCSRLLVCLRAARTALAFLLDALFGIACGLAAVLVLYYTNDGQLRLSAPAAMAGGFAVWQLTVGRLNGRLTRRITGKGKKEKKKERRFDVYE